MRLLAARKPPQRNSAARVLFAPHNHLDRHVRAADDDAAFARRSIMRASMQVLTGVVLIAAAHAASPALSAEAKSATPPGFSQSAPNISDQKLDATAAALKRIASLQQDFRQQMAKAVTDQG